MNNGKVVVLHVITRLIGGGADENTVYTLQGITAKDGDFQCLLAGGIQSDLTMLKKLNGKLPFIIVPNLHRNICLLDDWLALCSLIRLCRKTQCDILHTHTAKAGILGRIAGKIAGVPVIVHTLHGSTFHPFVRGPARFLYHHLEKLTAHFCNRIISVSSVLSKTYVSQGVGKPEQYITIHSGMPLKKYLSVTSPKSKILESLGIRSDHKIVGTICQLEARKGVSFFLAMAKAVAENMPGCKFIVVGKGEQRQELEALTEKLGLENEVIFTGYRDDVPDLLSIFDVFVLTSLWEGLPRVLVQAAAAGKPVVAFNVDGVPEIVKDAYNGYLVKPKDLQRLVDRVVYLLKNPDAARDMGTKGREIVGRQWTIDAMVSQTRSVYRSLLEQTIYNGQKHLGQSEPAKVKVHHQIRWWAGKGKVPSYPETDVYQ
jgi:glycosyltransferase involved in cell wall biosynthesis